MSEYNLKITRGCSEAWEFGKGYSWILDDEAVEALVEGSRVTLGIVSFYYADPAQACPVQRLMPDI